MSQNEPKQVIIVRKDLHMRKGKIAAQVAHASLAVLVDRSEVVDDPMFDLVTYHLTTVKNSALHKWLSNRFTKICLYVESEKELVELYRDAKQAKLPCALITDAGLTEFGGVPTKTCVAIGPDYPDKIDPITEHLKLL